MEGTRARGGACERARFGRGPERGNLRGVCPYFSKFDYMLARDSQSISQRSLDTRHTVFAHGALAPPPKSPRPPASPPPAPLPPAMVPPSATHPRLAAHSPKKFHTQMQQSLPTETTCLPSGLKCAAVTSFECAMPTEIGAAASCRSHTWLGLGLGLGLGLLGSGLGLCR